MAKHHKQSLRKRNCERIARAFLPHFNPHTATLSWLVNYLDPLSIYQNIHGPSDSVTFWCKSTQVQVPVTWFWREIEDWEIEGLITEWKLIREY